MLVRLILCCALALAVAPPVLAQNMPRVEMVTSLGTIVLELDSKSAPKSVANFLAYVDSRFYNGTQFHRVIPGFMIQGGGFTSEFQRKATRKPVTNEADNGLKNQRGTLAMARTSDPHSATAQFFINTVNNQALDHRARNASGWGYAVLGKVVEGMGTVDKISAVQTGTRNGMRDVPTEPVIIKSVRRVTGG